MPNYNAFRGLFKSFFYPRTFRLLFNNPPRLLHLPQDVRPLFLQLSDVVLDRMHGRRVRLVAVAHVVARERPQDGLLVLPGAYAIKTF